MDIQLNNGTLVTNVTPAELKQLIEMGLVGKTTTTNNVSTTGNGTGPLDVFGRKL